MPSDPASCLRDIYNSIEEIRDYLGALTLPEYRLDRKTKSAVERQLQILTEAAIRLGKDVEELAPGPDWSGYRGMGNFLRHSYEHVNDELIWNTIQEELPQLRRVVLLALNKLEQTKSN